MRLRACGGFLVATLMLASAWSVHGRQVPQPSPSAVPAASPVNDHRASKEQLERWMKELSNWGRWGKDDEMGALNLITDAKRKQASALVKSGKTVSLSHDLALAKAPGVSNPFVLQMRIMPDATENGIVSMDRQDIDFHGGTTTHLDALCHVGYEGKIYNGFNFQESVTKEGGCARGGLTLMKDGIVTRGILLDIPRLKGVPSLDPGAHVYREDIEAWERRAGVRVSSGDAIFLRVGRWLTQAKHGPAAARAGFDASVVPFLKERDVALIGADWTQDVGSVPGFLRPIHRFAIVAFGAPLIDNADLDALAELAASQKRWEFMVVVAPPRVPKTTGSPINPIAIF